MALENEKLIPLEVAAQHFPSWLFPNPPCTRTLRRWWEAGRLETIKVGRRRLTSKAAVKRCVAQVWEEAEL